MPSGVDSTRASRIVTLTDRAAGCVECHAGASRSDRTNWRAIRGRAIDAHRYRDPTKKIGATNVAGAHSSQPRSRVVDFVDPLRVSISHDSIRRRMARCCRGESFKLGRGIFEGSIEIRVPESILNTVSNGLDHSPRLRVEKVIAEFEEDVAMRGLLHRTVPSALTTTMVMGGALFIVTLAGAADAAAMPGLKVCTDTTSCDVRKPDQRVLPAGVMFASAQWTEVASDAYAAPPPDRKQKREARREARKHKRAAKRTERKQANTS